MLTKEQFVTIFPGVTTTNVGPYYAANTGAMLEFGVTTFQRAAAFLAQIGHETAGLRYLQELGGLDYFKRYDGRQDLGNTEPGDGARFHGRGEIQLTGRANYKEFGDALGLDLIDKPEQAAQMPTCARIAGLFWKRRGCNELADEDRFEAITRKINGGLNGIEDRWRRWDFARRVFGLPIVVRA